MKDFRNLEVWANAHRLTLSVYEITKCFPVDERFGLISQMRRSSASVATNIAEGCGRRGNGDFSRFLQNAMGSASELEYQFLLSRDLEYLSATNYENLERAVQSVKRMLASLIRKVDSERHQPAR